MGQDIDIRVGICILHYGSRGMTDALLQSFIQAIDTPQYTDQRVFVLDNAAPEQFIGAWHRLDTNIYWPGAFAHAIDAFTKKGFTHLWFCNNDISLIAEKNIIKRLESRIAWQNNKGAVGLFSPTYLHNPYHPHMQQQNSEGCRDVPYIDGIAPIVSLQAVESIGGLDYTNNPYGYGVDIWLSRQLLEQGWRVVVDDAITLRHKYHTTAATISGFLEQAVLYEDAYLCDRLGQNWKEQICFWQKK